MRLEAEPLALPWPTDPDAYDRNGTNTSEYTEPGFRVRVSIRCEEVQAGQFRAWLSVYGDNYVGGEREVVADGLEALQQKCDQVAGLFVAALGLARPTESEAEE